jgi:hypothetical protein
LKGADTHRLELLRLVPEQITFRTTPVLTVHAAHPVPAAPKADPHGQPRVQHHLHDGKGHIFPNQ